MALSSHRVLRSSTGLAALVEQGEVPMLVIGHHGLALVGGSNPCTGLGARRGRGVTLSCHRARTPMRPRKGDDHDS